MKINLESEQNLFRSSDIALCAALCCFGYHIEAVEKLTPTKSVFLIKRDSKLDNLIQQYFIHQLKVEPLGYFNFLKEIKTRLYHS